MSDDLAARLREQGLRLTPQRELILAAVEQLGHATPDEVLAHVRGQVRSVNASTVYRTLEVLEELGLVRHTHLSDRAPTYHSTREHEHVHAVCRSCRAVTSYDTEVVAPLVERLAADGFTVDVGHLAVFGVCADCAGRETGGRGDPT
ncbi:Fur family transcriptional regulator [Nocardioides sp. Soil774]|uniref:Fur family transcriptional regulator n=1 Tax=Nocardioides sp. Soil774 TaxID=1736408 RepID=UPI0006F3F885|nr:Fur family transcriptional regulator [Nocardioides sp. Soil774]KRE97249.1 Fur family transcriptional regulator [Nocardioides sp. Soil774]